MGWYDEEQWRLLKSTADDPTELDESYGVWLISASRAFERFQAEGADIHRIYVNVSDLNEWCETHGIPNTGPSRARYVADKVRTMAAGDARPSNEPH
jgi:hypothetical protein